MAIEKSNYNSYKFFNLPNFKDNILLKFKSYVYDFEFIILFYALEFRCFWFWIWWFFKCLKFKGYVYDLGVWSFESIRVRFFISVIF